MEDEYEQLLAHEAAIKAAIEDTSIAKLTAKAIQEATDAQAELYNKIKSGLENTYATDDDKGMRSKNSIEKTLRGHAERTTCPG